MKFGFQQFIVQTEGQFKLHFKEVTGVSRFLEVIGYSSTRF